MATTEEILRRGDKVFSSSEEKLLRSVRGTEIIVYDELIKILNKLTVSGGKLQTNAEAEAFLLNMDAKIYAALKKADYNNSVLQYTKNFNLIAENTKELHSKVNSVNITDAQISPILKIEVNNTIDKLTGAGISKDFINPIRESLYRNIMLGAELTKVEETIREFVVSSKDKDSRLMRYVKQVSQDSLGQFDGTIQQNIQKSLGLNAVRYIGSLIKDSRKQCQRWVTNDRGVIMLDDLQDQIDWAYRNGSGMIPGTTVDNFLIYRAGYNCRHRAIPINKKK